MLNIRLFGQFQMTYANQPSIPLTKRSQTLLAYLLLQRDLALARQAVAFRLWPDTTENQSRSNLRTELTRLRHAFPAIEHFVQDERHVLRWCTDTPFTLDVANFEKAIQQAEQAAAQGHEADTVLALQRAVAFYTGDLLPHLYEDWVLSARQQLSDAFVTALEQLIGLLKKRGAYAQALQVAQQLLRYDAVHETAYRHLMELYALQGNQAGVERTYQACVKILQQELAVAPSAMTQQLYQDVIKMQRSIGISYR